MVPTSPFHESLHLDIYNEIYAEIRLMGRKLDWLHKGSATLRAHGHPGGDGGEGDSSGGPAPQRAGNLAWPTLVVEAGVSETLSELREDMRWWFSASDYQVKIVLAKLVQAERTITLEKWVEVQEPCPRDITRGSPRKTSRAFSRLSR